MTLLRIFPTWLLGVAIVALALTLTVLGSRGRKAARGDEQTAVVTLHATVSTVYTVTLAFVVIIVWQQFTDASSVVQTEATRLSNLLRDSRGFPEAAHGDVRASILRYVELAAAREWPAMAEGRNDETTARAYEGIWEVVYRIEPRGPKEEAFYGELLVRLNELGAARRTRLLSARASVPLVLWILLVAGAVLVIGVSYLVPGASTRAGVLALAGTSCLIALTLFLILVLDHPFSGDISVSPSPLTDLLSR